MSGNPSSLFKSFQPIGPTTLKSLADWLDRPPADPEVSAPRPFGQWRVASLLLPSCPSRVSALREQTHAPQCSLASHRFPLFPAAVAVTIMSVFRAAAKLLVLLAATVLLVQLLRHWLQHKWYVFDQGDIARLAKQYAGECASELSCWAEAEWTA